MYSTGGAGRPNVSTRLRGSGIEEIATCGTECGAECNTSSASYRLLIESILRSANSLRKVELFQNDEAGMAMWRTHSVSNWFGVIMVA